MKKKLRSHFVSRRVRLYFVMAFALMALAFVPDFNAQQPLFSKLIPLGLPSDTWSYYVPKDNPMTEARIDLGRKLFFDERLSADGRIACATCHKPELAFTDGKVVAEGIEGKRGTRNSPTLLNAMFTPSQFWDGRAGTLEEQAIQPLTNPLEMGNRSFDDVVSRLRQSTDYPAAFRSIFGSAITIELVGKVLSAYERTLVAGDSPFDRFIAGDQPAISEAAKRGFALFRGKARCSRCHTFNEAVPFFTDFNYHNTGVAVNHPNFNRLAREAFAVARSDRGKEKIDQLALQEGGQELGRILVSFHELDLGSFRTPSLRNIALTAPYFHDGSAKTLADVVRFYNHGGLQNINREWDLNALALSEDEQHDLVSFLETLTGKMPAQPLGGNSRSTISGK